MYLLSGHERINADNQLGVRVPLWQLQLSAEQHEAGLCPRHHPRREQVSQRPAGQGQQPGHVHPPSPPPPPPPTTSADCAPPAVHSIPLSAASQPRMSLRADLYRRDKGQQVHTCVNM